MKFTLILLILAGHAVAQVNCDDFYNNVEGVYSVESPYNGEISQYRYAKGEDGTLNVYEIFSVDCDYAGNGLPYMAGEEVWSSIWILEQDGDNCYYNEKPAPELDPFYDNLYDSEEFKIIRALGQWRGIVSNTLARAICKNK